MKILEMVFIEFTFKEWRKSFLSLYFCFVYVERLLILHFMSPVFD